MSQYLNKVRTNFITLHPSKTKEDFEKFLQESKWNDIYERKPYYVIENKQQQVGFIGDIYGMPVDGEPDESNFEEWIKLLQEFLVESETFIIQEVGWENTRYLVSSVVVISKTAYKQTSMDDVAKNIISEFGLDPNKSTKPQY